MEKTKVLPSQAQSVKAIGQKYGLQYIHVEGARENNLKNIDITIPRNKLVVITGLSGSGKSSLAFDTLYAEGQRRYIESYSSYIRQFLGGSERLAGDVAVGHKEVHPFVGSFLLHLL